METEIKFPRKRYFTFGFDHRHPITRESLKDCYIELEENFIDEARMRMFEVFGNRWAHEYGEDRYDRAIAKYNLVRVDLAGNKVE